MKTTIDAAGRVVVPKSVREAARIEAGAELEVRLVGNVIELTPIPRSVRIEKRGQLVVAVPGERDKELTQEEVDATLRLVRERDTGIPRSRRGRKKS